MIFGTIRAQVCLVSVCASHGAPGYLGYRGHRGYPWIPWTGPALLFLPPVQSPRAALLTCSPLSGRSLVHLICRFPVHLSFRLTRVIGHTRLAREEDPHEHRKDSSRTAQGRPTRQALFRPGHAQAASGEADRRRATHPAVDAHQWRSAATHALHCQQRI